MALPIRIFTLVLALVMPAIAEAHPGHADLMSWSTGFAHPFSGWDHVLVMVAVGLWAAQQHHRRGWLIPVGFIAAMALGGVAGAMGGQLPGLETVLLVSVIVFAVLVLARARLSLVASLTVVGFFAFFHGFAHAQEMPGTASLLTYGFGFLLATALLHAAGYAVARVAIALAAGKHRGSTRPIDPTQGP